MKTIKKQKVTLATDEQVKSWNGTDNTSGRYYFVERKVKNECSEIKKLKLWLGSMEEFYTKFNVMTDEEYTKDREKTYKQNFR